LIIAAKNGGIQTIVKTLQRWSVLAKKFTNISPECFFDYPLSSAAMRFVALVFGERDE
jgi:hypothetical protein